MNSVINTIFNKKDAINKIKAIMNKKNMSQKEIAYKSGRNHSTISDMLNIHIDKNIHASSIVMLGHALGLTVNENLKLLNSIKKSNKEPSIITMNSKNKLNLTTTVISKSNYCSDNKTLFISNLLYFIEKSNSLNSLSKSSGLSIKSLWNLKLGSFELLPICIYDGYNKHKIFMACKPIINTIYTNKEKMTKLCNILFANKPDNCALFINMVSHDYHLLNKHTKEKYLSNRLTLYEKETIKFFLYQLG